jgi:polyribonucleotide nucleotidyltransferase
MKVTETVRVGGLELSFEAGHLARLAGGAMVARAGRAWVLAVATAAAKAREGIDFAPLTVEYRERLSAVGKIPANFHRREGAMSPEEVLTSRLIDRSLRPLLAPGFYSESQVLVTVYGAEPGVDLESLAMLAALGAAHLSDLPMAGPAAGARVVSVDGELRLAEVPDEKRPPELELLVAVDRQGIVMAEGWAWEIPDARVGGALEHAHAGLQPVLDAFERLRSKVGRSRRALGSPAAKGDAERGAILEGRRQDGRGPAEVRPIQAEVGTIPAAHGSALFERGATQALCSATLGSERDAQDRETLFGRKNRRFLLHYHFPAFAAGEGWASKGPGRREIGHGDLARRALVPVLPPKEEFPYTVRVTSDILASDGSSSMATVCGASLALMDAGVPLRAAVAGIAMGLVWEGDRSVVLSDISATEDRLGDMDFKIAGSRAGVTALQLDNKLGSVAPAILARGLLEARRGLNGILDAMDACLPEPRPAVAEHAPQLAAFRIEPRRVGAVVGANGKTLHDLQSRTGTRVEVSEDGRVAISGRTRAGVAEARRRIEMLAADLKVGGLYRAQVTTIKDYGAFVRFGDHEGLVHVSELAATRVSAPGEVVSEGQAVVVVLLGVDARGRLKLSTKAAAGRSEGEAIRL